jgi:hypothetical protein
MSITIKTEINNIHLTTRRFIMDYFTGVDVHSNFCQFQHMDNTGALGLTMRVPTDKAEINKFLNLLDEPTTMTFEAG